MDTGQISSKRKYELQIPFSKNSKLDEPELLLLATSNKRMYFGCDGNSNNVASLSNQTILRNFENNSVFKYNADTPPVTSCTNSLSTYSNTINFNLENKYLVSHVNSIDEIEEPIDTLYSDNSNPMQIQDQPLSSSSSLQLDNINNNINNNDSMDCFHPSAVEHRISSTHSSIDTPPLLRPFVIAPTATTTTTIAIAHSTVTSLHSSTPSFHPQSSRGSERCLPWSSLQYQEYKMRGCNNNNLHNHTNNI